MFFELRAELSKNDREIEHTLNKFDYTRESVLLLHLVPLVQVAWAEGRVTKRERLLILEAARLHGIEESHPEYERLQGWLDFEPIPEFFDKSLGLIRAMLHTLPAHLREAARHDLISLCTRVAEISGGEMRFSGGGRRICDQELEIVKRIAIELSREKQQELLDRLALSEAIGITDHQILNDLREMGYTPATVRLIPLVPLIEIAWAEGNVTRRERNIIFSAARLRGIRPGNAAYELLAEWLATRPSDEFFARSFRAVTALFNLLPPELREVDASDLLSYCTRIAEASDVQTGFSRGPTKICPEEEALLRQMSEVLKSNSHPH
jgi:hypothetical protein